jgi:hypothetical protein
VPEARPIKTVTEIARIIIVGDPSRVLKKSVVLTDVAARLW